MFILTSIQKASIVDFIAATGGGGYDADAQAFIDAVGTLTTSEEQAVDTFVGSLKSNSLWDKMAVIYPFIGGTADEHKWNLKDPRDLDAAYRLDWVGSPSHDSSSGVVYDGVSQYADTHFTPSNVFPTNPSSAHISVFSESINEYPNMIYNYAMGSRGNGFNRTHLRVPHGGSDATEREFNHTLFGDSTNFGLFDGVPTLEANITGFVCSSHVQDSGTIYINGQFGAVESETSDTPSDYTTMLAAYNDRNTILYESKFAMSFISIGSGLTAAEVTALNNAVRQLRTDVGRPAEIEWDADALTYLTSGYTLSTTDGYFTFEEQTGINTFVKGLKDNAIWDKMAAIYPMVGAVSGAHKWNMKDVRDVDAAYRLDWVGSPLHDRVSGVIFDGIAQYADTHIHPLNNIPDPLSTHLSALVTGDKHTGIVNETLLASRDCADEWVALINYNTGQDDDFQGISYEASLLGGNLINDPTNPTGFHVLSRTGSENDTNSLQYWHNAGLSGQAVGRTTSDTLPNPSLYNMLMGADPIDCDGIIIQHFSGHFLFASIGSGLNGAEVTGLYNAVNQLQTDVGRPQ